jgi:hypothetical protein
LVSTPSSSTTQQYKIRTLATNCQPPSATCMSQYALYLCV